MTCLPPQSKSARRAGPQRNQAIPIAGAIDHIHGDEGLREWTPAEQVQIERRTAELIAERLVDKAQFDDLLSGIEPKTEMNQHLQRIVLNICFQDGLTTGAIRTAGQLITRRILQEAREAWGEECARIAEGEIE